MPCRAVPLNAVPWQGLQPGYRVLSDLILQHRPQQQQEEGPAEEGGGGGGGGAQSEMDVLAAVKAAVEVG